MAAVEQLITDNIATWAQAVKKRNATGRGSSKKIELYGIKKLRELILELAVRGKLVPQNPEDEPASVLLERIGVEKAELVKEKKIKKSKELPAILEKEQPFSAPGTWTWCRFQDVADYIQRGKGPIYADIGTVRVISQKCVQRTGFDLHPAKYVTDESLEKYQPERFLLNQDILWNSTGTGTVGRAVVLNDINQSLVADSHVTVIRPRLVSSMYLWCFIMAPGIQSRIAPDHENALVSGSTKQVELNTSSVLSLEIPVPPLAEQHRIVIKVNELMSLCDQLEQQTETSLTAHTTLVENLLASLTNSTDAAELEQNWQRIAEHFTTLFTTEESIDQLKQTVLQLAVMGKLVPQDPNDEPASVLLEKIAAEKAQLIKEKKIKKGVSVDTIIQENCDWIIPNGWHAAELQELFRFIDYRGKNPKKSESGKRIITAKNIRMGHIQNHPVEYISEELYKSWMVRGFPQKGDILFVTEGHTMGFVASVDLDFEFALAQRTICFQPFKRIHTEYLFYALMSQQFQSIVVDNQTGSAAGGIKASKLKRVPLPVPPEKEQVRIAVKIRQLMSFCDQIKTHLQQAQQTRLHLADAMVEKALT